MRYLRELLVVCGGHPSTRIGDVGREESGGRGSPPSALARNAPAIDVRGPSPAAALPLWYHGRPRREIVADAFHTFPLREQKNLLEAGGAR